MGLHNAVTLHQYLIKVGILAASDKGSRGEREDKSGQLIADMVKSIGGQVVAYDIIPDEFDMIRNYLIIYVHDKDCDLILTTGGTGLSPRDVTPEATLSVLEKEVPGIAEAMRIASLKITPKAMLSRAVAGIRKKTLIVNLPGSPKAVRECLEAILPALPHGIEILKGQASECAEPDKK